MPVVRKCKVCKKEFFTKPYFIKHGGGKYCSPACHHLGIKTGKLVACFVCKKEVYRPVRRLNVSKSKKYFCTKSCQTKWRNEVYIGEKHANWKTGLHSYRSVLTRHHVPKICRLCKTNDKRVLAVHHIDKNRKNNTLSNLAWLCHNCHFLVHHDEAERKRFMVPIV